MTKDKNKCVVTITGIRPDFIRMSEIFKKLDTNFKHILIHTGQHNDTLLSSAFFIDLNIKWPDYLLESKNNGYEHYNQLAYLSKTIPELLKKNKIKPDLIVFLGDSNSACAALPLRKEGYNICHIEAGMRSYDKRMFEEINRTVCDHCSHLLLVYHDDYKANLAKENIKNNVYVVGNTIKEVCKPFADKLFKKERKNNVILADIHRPENFKDKNRMENIIKYLNVCSKKYGLPVKMLTFHGIVTAIKNYNLDLGNVELIKLMRYKKYLTTCYHSMFVVSDSGTAQEELAMLNTPVIVPRDFTERIQSFANGCSYQLDVNSVDTLKGNSANNKTWRCSFGYISDVKSGILEMSTDWLGKGNTSDLVIKAIKKFLDDEC